MWTEQKSMEVWNTMQHEFLFIITNALGLHASLMDIPHDTSFRSILEDDSISSTSI
jgi:hypothetical protein